MKNYEIEKYIDRNYELESISIEEYIDLCKELSAPNNYKMVVEENKKYDKYSSLLRKRIDPQRMSIDAFEELIREICKAKNDTEINEIMAKHSLP